MDSIQTSPDSAREPLGLITLAIVAYNEHDALPDILSDVLAQDFPRSYIEIILVDSASTDDTRAIMEEFAQTYSGVDSGFKSVRVLDNPARIIPAGWNVALRAFSGDAFLRIDAHARIPSDFVRMNVTVLNEGEYVCGGSRPATVSPDTPWTRTLLMAEESAFGSSVADYRQGSEKKYTSAVFLPAFRREVIERVGLYDERLLRTEDNDYCYRIRTAGFRIRFDARIHSTQVARNTLGGMMRQKYGNGYWVGRTAFIQPKCLHAYHFAPFIMVVGALVLALGAAITSGWIPLVGCVVLYLALCVVLAVRSVMQANRRFAAFLALPLLFPCIHVSYGIGTSAGLLTGIARGRK